MRKFGFYTFCIGGVAAFCYAVKYAMHAISPDMAIGVGIGFGLAVGLFALNERLDLIEKRRSLRRAVVVYESENRRDGSGSRPLKDISNSLRSIE